MLSPAVITSKAAQKDFANIKAQHTDLMGAMDLHQLKVTAYNQQKAAEQQQQQAMHQEMQKAQMASSSESVKIAAQQQKDMMQHTQKMAELQIKRDALNQTE